MSFAGKLALGALGIAFIMLCVVDFGVLPAGSGFAPWLYAGLELVAVVVCVVRTIRSAADRPAWAAFSAYAALWMIADVAWLLEIGVAANPNWTDAVYLASYAGGYAGLVLLLRAHVGSFRPSLALDGLLCGLGLGALFAATLFGPAIDATSGSALIVATSLGYVVGDLLLICVIGMAFALTGWRPGRVWVLLVVSLGLTVVADGLYGYLEATGRYDQGAAIDPLWPASLLAVAAAARQPARRSAARHAGMGLLIAPGGFALLALAVLVIAVVHDVPLLATGLAVAALLCAGARAWLTFAENVRLLRRTQHDALTDALTGLGNRRALAAALDDTVGAGTPATLGYFDLDGFKRYNDTFGHGAGDALLARLGQGLRLAVSGVGAAYRLGGDEFCVLLYGELHREAPALRAATAALVEHGEGFSVSASCGVVALPSDTASPAEALQLADQRMYEDKETRRETPRRQARDLLLQVLREREPELEEHVSDVGCLAVAVARELGLASEDLDVIARGAELHDVGKIAVPDKILNKPGPLDELEWRIMRQHTIVGERILAAAPALAPVARLVRSSHERWDGRGYPDGLAGAEIPLGARIIAACDAFDAMRQERPYAPTMPEAAALAELDHCAGTQFDPAVVAALAAVLAAGVGVELRVA